MGPKIINIEPLSAASLYVESFFNETLIANATSFMVKRKNKFFLLTNRHIVTGRDQNTGKPLDEKTAAIPNKIRVYFNMKGCLGGNIRSEFPLLINEKPAWYEHPFLKESIDVVAFPVPVDDSSRLEVSPYYDLDVEIKHETGISLKPGVRLNIIGFPFAKKTMNNFGIWITGFLASDFDIDIDGDPKFYIDARTRTGQSGSPVVFYRHGESVTLNNNTTHISWSGYQLLGIYSGRIAPESDIGIVWKTEVICELLDAIKV
jgi:hypothetical protein